MSAHAEELPHALADAREETQQQEMPEVAPQEQADWQDASWLPDQDNAVWGGAASLLLFSVFLILLEAKLDGRSVPHGWAGVLGPLFLLDGLWIARDLYRVKQYWKGQCQMIPHAPAYRLLHTLCLVCTKILLLLRAYTMPDLGFTIALCPTYFSAIVGTVIIWAAPTLQPSGAEAGREMDLLAIYGICTVRLLCYGLQPLLLCLRLDHPTWRQASWAGLIMTCTVLGLMLFVSLSLTSHYSDLTERARFRELPRPKRVLVRLLGLAVLLLWGWEFLAFVAICSTKGMHATALMRVLRVTIALVNVSLVYLIALGCVARWSGSRIVDVWGGIWGDTIVRPSAARREDRHPSLRLRVLGTPVVLLRQSSTFSRQVSGSILQRLSVADGPAAATSVTGEEDPAKMCYMCESAQPDAVLLDCGHGGVCYKRAQELATRAQRVCPICRRNFVNIIKLHTASGAVTGDHKYVWAEEGCAVSAAFS